MQDRMTDYMHKCKTLKQIQSDKALRYRYLNNGQNFITVFVSAFITFIGFSGFEKMKLYIMMIIGKDINIEIIQMINNLLVFALFFVVIFHLVFQFGSKQTDAEKAVSLLSSLINEINDLIDDPQKYSNTFLIDTVRFKYVTITQIIPSNTDREYIRAKKHLENKEKEINAIETYNLVALSDSEQREYILNIIDRNITVQRILEILGKQNEKLFLGGGVIRNLVWDDLHNHTEMTPIEDIDVIYFDNCFKTKERDILIENRLKREIPNFTWSVKNQARMNIINNDEPYTSIEDAISKWPETVSAMLLRKENEGTYEFIAPFNFDDLFRLIVRPTPHFANKIDAYRMRIETKNWKNKWKKLEIFYTF